MLTVLGEMLDELYWPTLEAQRGQPSLLSSTRFIVELYDKLPFLSCCLKGCTDKSMAVHYDIQQWLLIKTSI